MTLEEKIYHYFDLVNKEDLLTKEIGKYVIDDDCYYLIQEYVNRDIKECRLEAHKKYVDIQLIIKGEEKFKVCSIEGLKILTPYDEEKDVVFYELKDNMCDVILKDNSYIILYPSDAHMPGIKNIINKEVRKVVIKVKI